MNILFFDTETTGKPKSYKARMIDVDNWPRLVQIGWVVFDDGTYCGHKEFIVRADGFEIPPEATAIHGITNEKSLVEGVNIKWLLDEFASRWLAPSDVIVGHNIEFDMNVVGAESIRCNGGNPFAGKIIIDTMRASTDFCAIPGLYGNKWPKLTELWAKLFPDTPYPQTHTALDDIRHTSTCFFELEKRGIISLPQKQGE